MGYNRNMKELTQRQKAILSLLDGCPTSLEVRTLTGKVYASEATVRRDLKKLEERGLILRTHGKALSARRVDNNSPLDVRLQLAQETKKRLARAAVLECVHHADVVMLDASSTVSYAVEYLAEKKVKVITSGIRTLHMLAQTELEFYSTGGQAVRASYSLAGPSAEDYVMNFNADVCLVSSHGLSPQGFACDTSEPESSLRKVMMRQSRLRVLLLDSSKLGKTCWQNLCHIREFDHVFCDKPLPPELAAQVKCLHVVEE